MCTACGRNNSPEWRKVSSFPFPFPFVTSPPRSLAFRACLLPDTVLRPSGGAGPAVAATPPTFIFFRWPTRCVGSALGFWPLPVHSRFAPANLLPLQDNVTDGYFAFPFFTPPSPPPRSAVCPFSPYPIAPVSARLGSTCTKTTLAEPSHLRLGTYVAFRHAASIVYTR